MQLDLKQVFQQEGFRLPLELSLDFSGEELDGAFPLVRPAQITGTVDNLNSVVVLRYRVHIGYQRECDRCLAMALKEYDFDFEHILDPVHETDETDEYIYTPDFRLDIYNVVREDVVLSLPTRHLCMQECKGLCPKCGCNLNRDHCECDLSEPDPRLAALRQLLDD